MKLACDRLQVVIEMAENYELTITAVDGTSNVIGSYQTEEDAIGARTHFVERYTIAIDEGFVYSLEKRRFISPLGLQIYVGEALDTKIDPFEFRARLRMINSLGTQTRLHEYA